MQVRGSRYEATAGSVHVATVAFARSVRRDGSIDFRFVAPFPRMHTHSWDP